MYSREFKLMNGFLVLQGLFRLAGAATKIKKLKVGVFFTLLCYYVSVPRVQIFLRAYIYAIGI